jgi:hypothetical protein
MAMTASITVKPSLSREAALDGALFERLAPPPGSMKRGSARIA